MADGAVVVTGSEPRYTLDVCDADWVPLGELSMPDNWQLIDRLCDVGTGAVDCPAVQGDNLELKGRGRTVLVRRPDRSVRASGVLKNFGVARNDSDTLKLTWDDPMKYLRRQRAVPNPGTDTGQGDNVSDDRTGWTSTVILGYVADNIGQGTGWRQAPNLVIGPDEHAGVYLSAPVQARYDNLLDLVRNVAIPNAAVFGVTTDPDTRMHEFWVRTAVNRIDNVVFSADLKNLGTGEWSLAEPEATRVYALGKGDGTDRLVVLVTTAESLRQEATWGASTYVHDSSSADLAALTAEAKRALSEKGETFSATYDVRPDGPFVYGVDYFMGDFVTVAPTGEEPFERPVREVTETWSASSGWAMKLTVGDYAATAQNGTAYKSREIIRRVDALTRNR